MLIQTYTIHGKPARVFPFPPNWASTFNETLEWRTDIMKTRDGSEQRRALRVVPRRGFEYQMLLQGDKLAMFESILWGWQHRHFALPVWSDIGKLTADADAGSTTLPVSTDTLSFRGGDWAIIFLSPTLYEVVQLDGVADDYLTLTDPTANDWPAGTKVYPLILSHLGTSVQANRRTDRVAEVAAVSFGCSMDSAYDFIPVASPPAMYDGIEVVTAKPNWKDAINNEFTREFDIADAGIGPIAYYTTETTSRIVRPFQWFLKSREDIVAFRSLLGRLRGQAKTVWMPSWHQDFTLAASNASDQSILTVRGTWFHTFVGVDTSRDRLAILLPNGTTVYRKITATAPNYANDTTQLQLDSTLGTTLTVANNPRINLLLRCRLATDKIVIPWVTDSVASPQTAFTTIKL